MINKIFDQFLSSVLNGERSILIIIGDKNSGKTSTLKKIVNIIEERNLMQLFTGFLALSESFEKKKYFAKDIKNRYNLLLMEESELISKDRISRFNFYKESFKKVEKNILNELENKASIMIIDEVAKLEMQNEGWAFLLNIAKEKNISLILTLRSNYFERIKEKFFLFNPLILKI